MEFTLGKNTGRILLLLTKKWINKNKVRIFTKASGLGQKLHITYVSSAPKDLLILIAFAPEPLLCLQQFSRLATVSPRQISFAALPLNEF